MNGFAKTLADRAEAYIGLRRSLGYSFSKQAATLRALVRYVEQHTLGGPLTRAMALDWVLSWEGTPNGRAIRYGVVRRFADYLAIYDPRTEALDPKTLPRTRATPPPRILGDEELGLPDVRLSTCFARLSGSRLGAGARGRIARQHRIALG